MSAPYRYDPRDGQDAAADFEFWLEPRSYGMALMAEANPGDAREIARVTDRRVMPLGRSPLALFGARCIEMGDEIPVRSGSQVAA